MVWTEGPWKTECRRDPFTKFHGRIELQATVCAASTHGVLVDNEQ